MSLTITNPTNGTTVSGSTVTLTGTSVQSVNGTALAAQSFSTSVDISTKTPGSTFSLSITNSGGDSASVSLVKQAAESADGTVVSTTTGQIIDANGNVWSLHDASASGNGNIVYENGAAPALGTSMNVTKLVYKSHKVYQVNVNDNVWYWDGTTPWVGPVADPSPVESANGATISDNTSVLYDASLNAWTLYNDPNNGNEVFQNGVKYGLSSFVQTLLYYNKTFYLLGSNNMWYSYSAGYWNMLPNGTDPRTPSTPQYNCPVQPSFYGVNGHFDWGGSGKDRTAVQTTAADYNVIVAAMKDVGLKTFRNGFGGWNGEVGVWTDFINNYATPNGICVYPNIEGDYTDPTTESAAYTSGYNIGVTAAGLKGLVPWYELDNEMDSWVINSGVDGTSPSHYDNSRFQIIRGYLRGMMDGVRSVDSAAKFVMGGITWTHFAFTEMLWNGTQPDGTTGHPTVRFDINAAHFYLNNNSDTDNPLSLDGGINWLQKVAEFGVPVRVTEFGANSMNGATAVWSSESALATALTNLMQTFHDQRSTYNIIGIDLYQIIDAAGDTTTPTSGSGSNEMQFGLMTYNGTKKGRYATVKSFVAANAV